MILDTPTPTRDELLSRTGWDVKPEGACKGDRCVPMPDVIGDDDTVDLLAFAERLGMSIAHDERYGLWALGPESGGKVLTSAQLPHVLLEDFDGRPFDLDDRRGRKVVLVVWASYCGCRFDLPGWGALHDELSPLGLTVVTVALDTYTKAARPFAELAKPNHPSLADPRHTLVELFGFTNIPFGMWIDEAGVIVRPADVAFAPQIAQRQPEEPVNGADQGHRQASEEARRREEAASPEERARRQRTMASVDRSGRYIDAIRDWVAKGAESEFALTPAEVVERSRPRPRAFGMAAAEFELAVHLHHIKEGLDAVPHFKEAHRLDPTNWSYHRQAIALARPEWGDVYDRDIIGEAARVDPDSFYPALNL